MDMGVVISLTKSDIAEAATLSLITLAHFIASETSKVLVVMVVVHSPQREMIGSTSNTTLVVNQQSVVKMVDTHLMLVTADLGLVGVIGGVGGAKKDGCCRSVTQQFFFFF